MERIKTIVHEPLVSIIILNWNNKILLETCLTSLKKETEYVNYRIIVVDNGSKDDSAKWVQKNFHCLKVVVLDKNYGFSIGNNKGIACALKHDDSEYILLLNNDTKIIQKDWLTRLIAVAESGETIGIVGCKLIYPDGRTQYIGTKLTVKGLSWLKPYENVNLPEIYSVDAALGACFLIKRSVIDKIGGLDAGFSPFSDEESDFCLRAKKAGFETCLISTISVVHNSEASINRVDSEYVRLVKKRNAIRFMLLNFPTFWLLKRVPHEVRIFIRCFFSRNQVSSSRFPIKLRDSQGMLMEVKINVESWLHNLKNLREILVKRQNRTMKLSL